MSTTDEFLMGGGTKSAFSKNDPIGFTVTGKIVSTEVRQQTSLEDGKPLTWDNGDPRMQLVVTLATDIADDEDDDGRRAVYVKGSKQSGSKSLHDAVRAAVQAAGARGLEPGGTLSVSYIGSEPAKTRGFSDRKLWGATYRAPDRAAVTGDFLGTTPTPVPAVQAPPVPAVQAAPAPAAVDKSPAQQAKDLIAIGLNDTEIADAVGLDLTVIAAIRRHAA